MRHFGKSKIFLVLCLSFLVGVFIGQYVNYQIMAICAMIFLILVTVWWGNFKFMLAGFLGLTMLCGALRYQAAEKKDFKMLSYGEKIELEAVVVEDPDVRADKTNLTVRTLKVISDLSPTLPRPGEGVENGKILLNVGRYPEYQYGDKLKIFGKLEEPFETADFSYKDYLSRYDIHAIMRFPKIEKLGAHQGSTFKSGLLAVKHKFQNVISQVLPEPHNALALGLILGLKRALPEDLKQALAIAGVSHIVVVSGYNMSILTRSLKKTRSFWGRRVAFILSLLVVMGFVVITGGEASVVRAAVMSMLAVLALNLGRMYFSVTALVFVAALMVLQNPKILNFDIGFQLSFLATAGLIYLSPILDKWLGRIPDILSFRTNLASSLAAQIFTLPLLIFYFDRISIISPLVNILILWMIPYAMFLAFFTGLVGILYMPAAHVLAALLWVILQIMIWIIEFFAGMPLASASMQIAIPAVLVYYLALAVALYFVRRKKDLFVLDYARYPEAQI